MRKSGRSRWRKKRYWLAGLVSILAAASLWMRSYNEAESDAPLRTQLNNYNSTEDLDFFLTPLTRAVRKFPTYEDCVEPGEGGGLRPKWKMMTNETQVKVCVYRIANHINNIEATRSFFTELGLRTSRIDHSVADARLAVYCHLDTALCELPPLKLYIFIFRIRFGYGVEIFYDNSTLVDVYIDYEIL